MGFKLNTLPVTEVESRIMATRVRKGKDITGKNRLDKGSKLQLDRRNKFQRFIIPQRDSSLQ